MRYEMLKDKDFVNIVDNYRKYHNILVGFMSNVDKVTPEYLKFADTHKEINHKAELFRTSYSDLCDIFNKFAVSVNLYKESCNNNPLIDLKVNKCLGKIEEYYNLKTKLYDLCDKYNVHFITFTEQVKELYNIFTTLERERDKVNKYVLKIERNLLNTYSINQLKKFTIYLELTLKKGEPLLSVYNKSVEDVLYLQNTFYMCLNNIQKCTPVLHKMLVSTLILLNDTNPKPKMYDTFN